MVAAPARVSTGLQKYPVCSDRLFTTLSDVWEMPSLIIIPVDYYFPMVSAFKHSHRMPAYMTEVRRSFKEVYAEAHLQMNCEAEKQNEHHAIGTG